MTDLVPDAPAEVVIAVCGEQAAGKTVFLTCIFQSIWTACPSDVAIDFDRKKIGNAAYFQGIEDALITTGSIPGTIDRAVYPARIYIRPYEPIPGPQRSSLSVDIVDFAGRHFRSHADPKNLLDESDAEDMKALREVDQMLESADTFVILLNSREINPLDLAPKRNPFSPSVNHILSRCRDERKPVALLFSQIDQTPLLTGEVLDSMPRVQRFRNDFTEDLHEALIPGKRPYGVVRRIACYETIADDLLPKKQDAGGNIWRPEPVRIVLDLIRAATPAIKQRLAAAESVRLEALNQERLAQQRKQRRQWSLAVTAAIVLLILVGVAALRLYQRSEGRKVAVIEGVAAHVRAGNLVAITPAVELSLRDILDGVRASPDDSRPALRSSIRDLQFAFNETGQRLAASPLLDATYGENLARFETLAPHFEVDADAAWRRTMPLFTARHEFLSRWFENEKKDRPERTRSLDEAAKIFTTDPAFAALLRAQSTLEKQEEIAGWQKSIDADPDVATRLATIQTILASALKEHDPEFTRLARQALAGDVVTTLLKRSENGRLRDQLLRPLVPDLANFQDGDVRFDVLARDLLNCATHDECAHRQQVVQSVIEDGATAATGSRSAVENTLRTLMLDLTREERREIWGAIASAMTNSYFFSGRADAWPDGVHPLHAGTEAWAGDDHDWTLEGIERLAAHPLYAAELAYLEDRLAVTEIRRRMVPIYSSLLDALSNQAAMLPAEALTEVSQEVSSSLAGHEVNSPLVELAGELNQVVGLVQSVNSSRSRGLGDVLTSSRLERLLRDARRGHCGALASHEAPEQCADAA
jgi:hypothetical protein